MSYVPIALVMAGPDDVAGETCVVHGGRDVVSAIARATFKH